MIWNASWVASLFGQGARTDDLRFFFSFKVFTYSFVCVRERESACAKVGQPQAEGGTSRLPAEQGAGPRTQPQGPGTMT